MLFQSRQKDVAGVLLSSVNKDAAQQREMLKANEPIVLLEQYDVVDETHAGVSFDFYKGGEMAMEHLIANGHTAIALLIGKIDRRSRELIYDAYRDTLKRHGITLQAQWVVRFDEEAEDVCYEEEYEKGRELTKKLLTTDPLPTAIFADRKSVV